MELTNVLLSPVVTEKSVNSQTSKKYTFLVHLDTNKVEIAHAVEKAYGVNVKSVNIIPVQKKVRLAGRGRQITKRHAAKKAVVTIGPKQTIDFSKVKASK